MPVDDPVKARTFFLNEQHELARSEEKGGGRISRYSKVDWAAKGTRISTSLRKVREQVGKSKDPVRESHLFVLANPQPSVAKLSSDKTKAPQGFVTETTDYSQKDSRVFRRLGIDLLQVAGDGSAVVHMKPELVEQLAATASALPDFGPKEQARWVTIDSFGIVPVKLRIDSDWLSSLRKDQLTDAVIEFQPLLTRAEVASLIRAVVEVLAKHSGEAVTGTGVDFTGRQWIRGKIAPISLRMIAEHFFSVQSVHSPLLSVAAWASAKTSPPKTSPPLKDPVVIPNLPSIGVVDTGVPAEHVKLKPYLRGKYVAPTSYSSAPGSHASFVASRIVFGDPDYSGGIPKDTPTGEARYYDINISGIGPGLVEDKSIYPALQAVVSTAPDVRVFNMSFDSNEQWGAMQPVKKYEALTVVQDIDNFIYQNDILVVVAAGNSPLGVLPSQDYPMHFEDPNWALGPLARSFNSLTCGSYVKRLSPNGLVAQVGWPSPFCRSGPGLCDSPKPDFAANGGNSTINYDFSPGLGVWGLSDSGLWEDKIGTSFSAPLLAREGAFCFQRLQEVCEPGSRPFAVTVKAFLSLTSVPPTDTQAVAELVKRTLGMGTASAERLQSPVARSAVMIWQGVLEGQDDVARVQIPIPRGWLSEAKRPLLRLVVAWDPPVNAAVQNLWATRRVSALLRPSVDIRALRPKADSTKSTSTYPLIKRNYDLNRLPSGVTVEGDVWLLELGYEQIAEYHPAISFPPQQRVAFALELVDNDPEPVSPQGAVQALPISQTMVRLAVSPAVIRTPILLRTTQ